MTAISLWYVRTNEVHDRALLDACRALLLPDERERHDRFMFDRHRHEYLVTRALARGVLARHLGLSPAALAFVRNAYGRPELDPRSETRFNLTNTTELVACAVADGTELGVDAEPLTRADQILGVVDTVFTAAERAELARLDAAERARRAVTFWTLKEAYMKARGMGMSLPVEHFEVVHGLRVEPPIEDATERWALSTHEIEGHLVSLCVEHRDRPVTITHHHADLSALLR